MKVIALYLPQYHCIPENDKWWGENYTEWTSLKKGEVLIEGQYQPRVPLNSNYYNLLDKDVQRWQVQLAHQYGIYGFCAYHYWFNGKLLLEKPMENYLEDKSLDLPFFFCWANNNWDNSWEVSKNSSPKTLIIQDFTNFDGIVDHFNYMLPFFKDSRYMKDRNRPVFSIYNPLRIDYKYLRKMVETWNKLARVNGFDGICFCYQWGAALYTMSAKRRNLFDYGFEYLPSLVDFSEVSKMSLLIREFKRKVGTILQKISGKFVYNIQHKQIIPIDGVKTVLDYDKVWNKALQLKYQMKNIVPGAFTDWDNTPRHHHNGKVILGSTPAKFEKYMDLQIKKAKKIGVQVCGFE